MTRKKGKSVSFDAMVKFFIQNYNIPTKQDFDKLQARLDQIERLIKSEGVGERTSSPKTKSTERRANITALDTIFDIIKRSRNGSSFKDIQLKTGYGDKKIRNVIFRLNKMGRIKRKSRGVYLAA